MANIVVTGATSMIGVALIQAALHDESIDSIFAVVKSQSQKLCRLPIDKKIIVLECNIEDYLKLPQLINVPAEFFFHLAWPRTATYNESYGDAYEKTKNILYVLDALRAAKKMGCKTFVGAGSQSEYGIINSGKISLDTICKPVRADGIIHLAAGQLVNLLAKQMGLNSAWLRVFSVYGINDRDNSMVKTTIRKMLNGEKLEFTACEQIWDYLYESDAGEAFLLAGKKVHGNKTYNVGYGGVKKLRDFILTIRDIVAPGTTINFGELPYPKDPVMNLNCDYSSLHLDTGWKPIVAFEEGVRKIYESMK